MFLISCGAKFIYPEIVKPLPLQPCLAGNQYDGSKEHLCREDCDIVFDYYMEDFSNLVKFQEYVNCMVREISALEQQNLIYEKQFNSLEEIMMGS